MDKQEKKELIAAVKYSDMPVDCKKKLVELLENEQVAPVQQHREER